MGRFLQGKRKKPLLTPDLQFFCCFFLQGLPRVTPPQISFFPGTLYLQNIEHISFLLLPILVVEPLLPFLYQSVPHIPLTHPCDLSHYLAYGLEYHSPLSCFILAVAFSFSCWPVPRRPSDNFYGCTSLMPYSHCHRWASVSCLHAHWLAWYLWGSLFPASCFPSTGRLHQMVTKALEPRKEVARPIPSCCGYLLLKVPP